MGSLSRIEPAGTLAFTSHPNRRTCGGPSAMIIDCHCHAGKGDLMTAPWNTAAPLGAYLRRARAAGVNRTVVFPPFHSDYVVANAALAKLVTGSHGRLIGFAFVHAVRDARRIADSGGLRSGARVQTTFAGGCRRSRARSRNARDRVPALELHHPAPR